MNRKLITKILKKKHNEWVASIKDESVRELADKNSIITGGSIASLLLNEHVKDYDYYFTNQSTVEAIANYYINQFNEKRKGMSIIPILKVFDGRVKIIIKSQGVVSEDNKPINEDFTEEPTLEENTKDYRPVFMSANAITLSDKVQLVIRFYGEPEEIHKNYDFVHCCNYWTSRDNKLVLNPDAVESLLIKQLYYQGSLYPICSVIRARKFLKKGWYINSGQYLKMCFQISELDLTNLDVLEEQLTGVDSAYFFQVIEYCKERKEKDPDFKITAPYLATIIDKIFG
jgi:hypothetical protein